MQPSVQLFGEVLGWKTQQMGIFERWNTGSFLLWWRGLIKGAASKGGNHQTATEILQEWRADWEEELRRQNGLDLELYEYAQELCLQHFRQRGITVDAADLKKRASWRWNEVQAAAYPV